MAGDVLEALGRVEGLEGVIVVSAESLDAERRARAAALRAPVEVVHDPDEAGQSAAALRGVRAAVERGRGAGAARARATAPRSSPAEVARAAGASRGPGVVIVPDRHGAGTNALLIAPPTAVEPAFGPGSFARHAALAHAAGARVRIGRLPSLELDVDTPGDLAALRAALAARVRRRAAHARAARRDRLRARGLTWRSRSTRCRACRRSAPATTSPRCSRRAPLDPPLGAGDVLVVAHKVVSKAEGRLRALAEVEPGERARALAAEHGKDPRHVQVVLDETAELLRADHGRLICRTRHGFTCANAGVDQSNAGAPDDGRAAARRPRRLGARPARARSASAPS